MMNIWRVAVFAISLVGPFSWVFAQEAELQAYYTTNRSFALGVNQRSSVTGKFSYPVIAYIPRTFIVFTRNRILDKKEIAGEMYLRVLTQDGVEAYVLDDTVSSRLLQKQYGGATVIFNRQAIICKRIGCDTSNDNDTVEVYGSDVLVMAEEQPNRGWILLSGTRQGEDFFGYISEDVLNSLNSTGTVTFSNREHPRFRIKRSEDVQLYKECGKTFDSDGEMFRDDLSAVQEEIDISDLGTVSNDGKVLQLSRSIGAQDQIHIFKKYEIQNLTDKSSSTRHAQIQYSCQISGGVTIREKIRKVLLLGKEQESPIVLEERTTPQDLKHIIDTSDFLWSVNTRDQYFDLLAYLSLQFGRDRTLAGYFLTEFNRSCSSQDRVGESTSLCGGHEY